MNSENKIMRFTFSKSLAKFLCTYDSSYTYKKFKFKVGNIASEKSENCVFVILSYTGFVLRMATTYERAKILVDDEYRFVFEAGLIQK